MNGISMILSILSMTLSIGNTLFIWCWQSRVHLKLTVKVRRVYNAAGAETEDRILRWQIVNRSAFAVYIDELGFCDYHKRVHSRVPSKMIHKWNTPDVAVEFPYKLESREGVEVVVSHSSQTEEMRKHVRMYVKTCCGSEASALIPPSTYTLIAV